MVGAEHRVTAASYYVSADAASWQDLWQAALMKKSLSVCKGLLLMYLCGVYSGPWSCVVRSQIGWLALAGTSQRQEARGACPSGCQEGAKTTLLVARPLQLCFSFFAAYSHAVTLQCALHKGMIGRVADWTCCRCRLQSRKRR